MFAPPTFITEDEDPDVLTNWQSTWRTGTQIRIDNIFIKGYQSASGPTIFNTYEDIDFEEVEIGESKTDTIQILASKVPGILTAATEAPFSVNKTEITGAFNEFNTTLEITFTPTSEGIFEKDFVLSGQGVEKTVKLRGISGQPSGIKQLKSELDYVVGTRGRLTINAPEARLITVIDITGKVIVSRQIEQGISSITLNPGQMYIVRIGNSYKKVIL